jgi:methyltransferase family protein
VSPPASRRLRDRVKGGLHTLFALGQRAGVDILPRHFYSSVPDVAELRRTEAWRRPMSMVGVTGADVQTQMAFVRECCAPLRRRLEQGGIHEQAIRDHGVTGFGPVEAEFLYCFIATKQPQRIVQVGCGVSTAVILMAARDAGYRPGLTCIEPFPGDYLRALAAQRAITLVPKPAQHVEVDVLTDLGGGDLLFVDSTHAVRPGSEVNWIILEALPRLVAGCYAHFHDICFPYDYQPTVLTSLFFPAESSLLHAFLIQNARCGIAASLSMLHHACPEELRAVLPNYCPLPMRDGLVASDNESGHFPSSTYLISR